MRVRCVCGAVLASDQPGGSRVRCPKCGKVLRLPGPVPVAPLIEEDSQLQVADDPVPGPAAEPNVSPDAAGALWPARAPVPRSASVTPTQGNGLAVAAFVLGLVSLLFNILAAIPAVILGALALLKASRSAGRVGGRGLAIAGVVLALVCSGLNYVAARALAARINRAKSAAQQFGCMSNLRQLSLAIVNYSIGNDDKMPPGDRNVFAYLNAMGRSASGRLDPKALRCTEHKWLPSPEGEPCSSYVFNVSLDATSNDQHSPFSMAGTRRLVRLAEMPADTFHAIEMWMRPGPDGSFPNKARLKDRDWNPIKAGCAPIDSYTATTAATFDASGRLVDPGPYRFLDCYKDTDVPVSRMYHMGSISVLSADGRIKKEDILSFTTHSPADDPRWTRQRD